MHAHRYRILVGPWLQSPIMEQRCTSKIRARERCPRGTYTRSEEYRFQMSKQVHRVECHSTHSLNAFGISHFDTVLIHCLADLPFVLALNTEGERWLACAPFLCYFLSCPGERRECMTGSTGAYLGGAPVTRSSLLRSAIGFVCEEYDTLCMQVLLWTSRPFSVYSKLPKEHHHKRQGHDKEVHHSRFRRTFPLTYLT